MIVIFQFQSLQIYHKRRMANVIFGQLYQNRRCLNCLLSYTIRFKSSKSSKSKRYANTLNLPQTSFPLSMKNGAAASREKAIQKVRYDICRDFVSFWNFSIGSLMKHFPII